MMIIRQLVIFAILFTASEVVNSESTSACYGTDPDCVFYSMGCDSGDVIRLYNLYVGYTNTTEFPICATSNYCSSRDTCCNLGGSDLIDVFDEENTYDTYVNCSGRTLCNNMHAPWQLISRDTTTVYSSYVHLEYQCQPVSSKIPFCGGSSGTFTSIDSDVEIFFDGSRENFDPLKASKECKCSVTNLGPQQHVVFRTIDVRLQTYHKSENQTYADCSSATFQSPVFATTCQNSNANHEDNFYNSEQHSIIMTNLQTVEISLHNIHTNGTTDSPAMVWISLSVQNQFTSGIRVTCEEVVPANFTTTTTTSTTNTTTSTTTTPTTTTTTTTTTTPTPTTSTTTTATPTPTTSTTTTTTPTSTTTTSTTTTPTSPTTTTTTTTPTSPTTTTTTTTPTSTTTTSTTTTPTPTTTTSTTTTPTPTTTTSTTTTPTPTTSTSTTTISSTTTSTTTTTPQPTTTTTSITSSTTATPTTTTPTTTTTTTTSTTKPTTTTTISTTTTTTPSPTTTGSTTGTPLAGDGESDVKQRTAVYLAICIPVIVGLFIITAFLLWIYWKRTSPRKKKFHFMKAARRSDVYNTFNNPKILDEFIDDLGVSQKSPSIPEKRPISTFISVPEASKRPRSILSNSSAYNQDSVQPYVLPIQATTSVPLYAAPQKGRVPSGVQVRLNKDKEDESPVVITDTVQPDVDDELTKLNDVYDPASENGIIDKPNKVPSKNKPKRNPDEGDGGIVIHVDNLHLPPVSARSTNADTSVNTSSTRSEIGSTPGNLTPERRNSEPALITTDPIVDRHSASAYVLPGSSPDDSSVLFVK